MKKTIGDLLREARTEKKLALQALERLTGIATHDLLALELDQFSLIDSELLEQYLRTYTQAVGLDYDSMGVDVETLLNMEQVLDEERPRTSYSDTHSEQQPDYVSESYYYGDHERHYRRSDSERGSSLFGKLLSALLFLGLLAAGGFFIYKTFLKPTSSPVDQTEAQPSSSELVANNVSETPVSSNESVAVSTTQLDVSGDYDYLDVTVVTDTKPVQVTFSVAEGGESWISLSNSELDEGGVLLNAEQPSYTATLWEDASYASLYMGVTPGVTITINDQQLDLSALTTEGDSQIEFSIQ